MLHPHAATASFQDCWQVPLQQPDLGVVALFIAIFGHRPQWMRQVMLARNRLAGLAGLAVPTDAEIMHPAFKPSYAVGEQIGAWPIFHLSETELVAGRDNGHLDFRVSVLKQPAERPTSLVVSTLCHRHNLFGAAYLQLVAPVHRPGIRHLVNLAASAGRL